MHAIILLGGLGTRLQQLYPDRPKALVPIAGKPILLWQIEWLKRWGINDIHLAAGYKADVLQQWLNQHDLASVSISVEPTPLGTGGGLKWAAQQLRAPSFFVLNGDSLMPNLDFHKMQQAHTATLSIAITKIEEAGRYGTVEFDNANHITAFREKAQREAGWINGGVYLINNDVLSMIPERSSLETDLFPKLAATGSITAFPAPPPLLDMGTPDGIAAMESYLALKH